MKRYERDRENGPAGSRRQFLAGAAAAGAASLGGCLGTLPSRPQPPGEGNGGTTSGTARDVLRFEALDVAGSPGGTVALRPPDRLALIDFFATWCGPCRPQMDTLGKIRKTFAPEELHMVSVTTESDETAVRRFWKQYDGRWPVVMNPEGTAPREYSVKGVPTLVVVSPDGTQHWRHRGLAGFDRMKREIKKALEG